MFEKCLMTTNTITPEMVFKLESCQYFVKETATCILQNLYRAAAVQCL